MDNEIYLDGNATTAVLPAALRAAVHAMEERYGNPSSTHATGLKARAMLDAVRARAGRLLVYGATEHKAVPESLAHWNALLGLGLELVPLPVGVDGHHDLGALRRLAPHAAFVCTMAANNETGVISDLAGIAAALSDSPALWMVDCVQALGKLPLALASSRIDYAPFSGHKLYAPKGIGMLYVRDGAPFTPLMKGGGQETGWRSGTENMAGIAALGAVLAALEEDGTFRGHAELVRFRDRLAEALRRALPDIVFNAPFDKALPTTLNFSVPGLSSKELLDLFDAAAVRVSAGSACSAAKAQPSYVLEAMGLPEWRSSSAVRLSFGPLMDEATVREACARIARCGDALRLAGLLGAPPPGRPDGLLQFTADGRHTWLVLDAASGTCAVIDPQPALADRIGTLLGAHGFHVAARLSTHDGATWPVLGDTLRLGRRCVRRTAPGAHLCYLLGPEGEAPSHAFIGNAAPARLAGLLPGDIVLCPATDAQASVCATLHRSDPSDAAMHLDTETLAALLRSDPRALLVDVREPYEHAAALPFRAARVTSIPLSRLAGELPGWLAQRERSPLVFFCRSGNRSARAAACLRAAGYTDAYHVQGGVALSLLP